ncbi:hypothetical protein D3874_09400 [Oleomonas cavernae]|uniref:Uncharacterized protein n=2 Tax=Oleomonas cavernae TaxID=2320859 RepID=A0A418WB89_9PROT|nr:hypothetical protein D3874_09400 [Oleomonas cavernae]
MMKWIGMFSAACTGMMLAVLFILWAFNDFEALGVGGHGLVALILGVVVTTGLGIGLMALVFHSDRSDHDEVVGH